MMAEVQAVLKKIISHLHMQPFFKSLQMLHPLPPTMQCLIRDAPNWTHHTAPPRRT